MKPPAKLKAERLYYERLVLDENAFAEMTVWKVPSPLQGSRHGYKYSLALVVNEECLMRYDNERGKGDHKHMLMNEIPYTFTDVDTLFEDFWADVDRLRSPK